MWRLPGRALGAHLPVAERGSGGGCGERTRPASGRVGLRPVTLALGWSRCRRAVCSAEGSRAACAEAEPGSGRLALPSGDGGPVCARTPRLPGVVFRDSVTRFPSKTFRAFCPAVRWGETTPREGFHYSPLAARVGCAGSRDGSGPGQGLAGGRAGTALAEGVSDSPMTLWPS